MDTQFVWQESFNIGVDLIDKEHQKLQPVGLSGRHQIF